MNLDNSFNPYVSSTPAKTSSETWIGTTQYDLQTNQSVQNRIYLYPDGTIGATFTFGMTSPSFADRGTGYNYFDGTSWGAIPTARTESARCGWPSYAPLNTGGEVTVSHNGSTGLFVTQRAAKGTGAWTGSTLIGPVPTNTTTTALLWPRAITVGNTIHLIACTDQNSTSGATVANLWYYQGMALALVYYKSTDGGATWSGPTILPGMDSVNNCTNPNNLGFGGDSYSWAAPHGDTIAFAVGDSWGDVFAMKSFDGGANWTKVVAYDFPDAGMTAPTGIVGSTDGSVACALDHNGNVCIVTGRMRVSDDAFTDDPPTSSYYPYTDGLLFWKEGMTPMDSLTLNDETLLNASGYLIAAMVDMDADSIEYPVVASGQWPFGNYYLSLSSMGQINIDENGTIWVSYSSLREDLTNTGANPNEQLYRHVYVIYSQNGGTTWSAPVDITGSTLHNIDECVFASMSYTSDANLHFVYMADGEPGLAVRGDEDGYADNYIQYIKVPKNDILTAGVKENASAITSLVIYPNPASVNANIDLNLASDQNVTINVVNMMGQTVYSKDLGTLAGGAHQIVLSTSSFNSGIYFVNITAGANQMTKKLIVE